MAEANMTNQGKLYRELPLTEFCREVSQPEIPSPAGGAVIGTVGAMLASLTELVVRVSSARIGDEWQSIVAEAQEWKNNLLRFADEDVQEAAKLIHGEGADCVRHQIAVPAKIASGLVKVLQLAEQAAGHTKKSVRADVRAIAYIGRGAADAIFEIEMDDIAWGGGGDPVLLARIEEWRSLAHQAADRILEKVRERA